MPLRPTFIASVTVSVLGESKPEVVTSHIRNSDGEMTTCNPTSYIVNHHMAPSEAALVGLADLLKEVDIDLFPVSGYEPVNITSTRDRERGITLYQFNYLLQAE